MSEKVLSLGHVSLEQRKTILDFMKQHVDFATGSLRTLEARNTSKKLWNDLTRVLNSTRTGAKKTADGWSKYWSDFKNKLKNKVTILKKVKRLGGTSTKRQIRPLTKLEKKALLLLGPHFEKKTGVKQTIDLCHNSVTDQLSTVVKLEASLESPVISYIPNNWPATEKNDKTSDAGNERNEYDEDFATESDGSFEEPVIHGVYPKWLVAIEKKRAESDYIRAKAEARRASATAKHAEAALMQAEALKKLADATHTQAEAIMKIATALDNRNETDDILVM